MKIQILLLIVLIFFIQSQTAKRKHKISQEGIKNQQKIATVVESNHFFSQKQTSTSFAINDIDKQKSIIFYLKQHKTGLSDKYLIQNPLTVTFSTSSNNKTCIFKTFHGLCSIPKQTGFVSLKIQCKRTPCQASWQVLQPASVSDDGYQNINMLGSVNKQKDHAMLKAMCNNPDVAAKFGDNLFLYTNSNYTKVNSDKGIITYLFDNTEQGQYYLTTTDQKISKCLKIHMQHASDILQFNSDKIVMDFINSINQNNYQFKTLPKKDFRIQFLIRDAELKDFTSDTGINLVLNYIKGTTKTPIDYNFVIDDEKDFMQFNIVFKKPTQSYDKVELNLKSKSNRTLIAQIRIIQNDVQDIQFQEQSHFILKKGQKINYSIMPLPKEVENINKIYISLSDQNKFKKSKNQCDRNGCQFTIQALQDSYGFVFATNQQKKKASNITALQFKSSITKKAREGQQLYFTTKLTSKNTYQILVNSPSVILYLGNKKSCQYSNLSKCYQNLVNYQMPTLYTTKQQTYLSIKASVLDNCEFTITVLNQNTQYIMLKDSIPFVYLMDNAENHLLFKFILDKKQDVSFNLIGPVNELNLIVFNKNKIDPQDTQSQSSGELSSDGYVQFTKQNIQELNFVIKVQKTQEYKSKFIHFTLIASTRYSNLRLQPSIAHYQTLKPQDSRDYVFEFKPKQKIFLNFYTHNIKESVNLNLKINNIDKYTDQSKAQQFTIDQQTDSLDISNISDEFCKKQQQNCQLFIRLKNKMDIESDVTITMIMEQSIIQLKDGIWQKYNVNEATTTAHFYFIPTHSKNSVTISYRSSLIQLKMIYKLFKTDNKSIDMSSWPFPNDNQTLNHPAKHEPSKMIHIDKQKLKTCWPNCVILMSLLSDNSQINNLTKQQKMILKADHDFKIMASNNLIQLPQRHKVDIVLIKQQQKRILIDLKYYLQKQQLIFYVNLALGSTLLKINVQSQKKARCPTQQQISDFVLIGVQTSINMSDIKKKMQENQIGDDKNIYLCMLVHAFVDSKLSVQFSSQSSAIKQLSINSKQTAKLHGFEQKIYSIISYQKLYIKMSRISGFPYASSKLCKPDSDFQKCLTKFKQSTDKGQQLVNKLTQIKQQSCFKCITYLKIKAQQQSQININVQTQFSTVQLKQNDPYSDALSAGQINRYKIVGSKNQQIIINIQINNGDLKVMVLDYMSISLQKSNKKGQTSIKFIIPAKDLSNNSLPQKQTFFQSFALSDFVDLFINVESQDSKNPATYMITYSSGQLQTFLHDGLISDYTIPSKKTMKFYFKNPIQYSLYLFISAPDVNSLNSLKTKIYGIQNLYDEDSKAQITTQKNQFKKKTLQPTSFIHLPPKMFYLFQIQNDLNKDSVITLGINSRQVIYLPFNRKFPVQLAPKDYIYIILTVSEPGYIDLIVNKCDQSYPTISYTEDYSDFVSEIFQNQKQMKQSLIYQNSVKIKKAGGFYIKFTAPADSFSKLTITASFSTKKPQLPKYKAGQKGIIQYSYIESNKIKISFNSIVCQKSDKNCKKDFSYYLVASPENDITYAQLSCASIIFDLHQFTQVKQAQLKTIPNTNQDKITYDYILQDHIQYIGIKAQHKNGSLVYYRPIEVASYWGVINLTATKNTHYLLYVAGGIGVCTILMAIRRCQKRKKYTEKQSYSPLQSVYDAVEDQD